MSKKQCSQCNQPYEAVRATSQYCSVTCRVTAKRNKDLLSVTDVTVTPNKESVTVTDAVTLSPSTQPIDVQRVPAPGHDPCMTATEVMTRMACAPHDPLHETNCLARGVNTCNTGPYKPSHELGQREVNRVSLPGDADYSGTWR